MKLPIIALVLLCGLTAPVLLGQALSVTISPNPTPTGTPVTVTAYDAAGIGLFTPGGCLISSVRSGGPGGPIVAIFPCSLLPVAIPACGSGLPPRTATWNQSVASGTYWLEISHSIGMFGPINTEWFCVTIDGPVPGPVLSAPTAPTVGNLFSMNLSAPSLAGSPYLVAVSGSSNTGILAAPGVLLCLDFDVLFSLSFPIPWPGLFLNFQGNLDATGQTPGLAIALPPLPSLLCFPFHAQAVVIDPSATIIPSNGLALTIL